MGSDLQARLVKLSNSRQTRLGNVLLQGRRHDYPGTDATTSHGSTGKAIRVTEPLHTSHHYFEGESSLSPNSVS
jgi:hypothetical protein